VLHLKRRLGSLRPKQRERVASIELSRDEAARARFCFLGEFGYEMISWLPYLRFLQDRLDIPLRTAGRPGSRTYYDFSADHIELDGSFLGEMWGESAA
jgi:hypothetical protein